MEKGQFGVGLVPAWGRVRVSCLNLFGLGLVDGWFWVRVGQEGWVRLVWGEFHVVLGVL